MPVTAIGGEGAFASPGTALNAKDYGAVGDDSTDDTAALQAAITAADTATVAGLGGGALYIPPGIYRVNGSLTVRNNVAISGAGAATVIRQTSTTAYTFVLSSGYRSRFSLMALDALTPQTDGGGFDMRNGLGRHRFADLTLGDNLYCYFDFRTTDGDGESLWAGIQALSLTVPNVVGVRNVAYGWRLGGGTTQLNGLYLDDITLTSATANTTTTGTTTWPLSGASVACGTLSSQWASSGNVWIGGVRCAYTGISGSTLTGVTGGAASDGVYPAGARVVQGGPVWMETNYADTILMSNFMIQNGDVGIREVSSANQTSALRLTSGSINAIAGPAIEVARSMNWGFINVDFNGCGMQSRTPQIRYAGTGTPLAVRFVGCTFQQGGGNATAHIRAGNEWEFDACTFDSVGGSSGGNAWGLGPFTTTVSTGGWASGDTTLNVDIQPPVGMRDGGVALVDSELVYYTATGYSSGQATLTCSASPNGRGAFGTTAAAHSAGATVTFLGVGVLVRDGVSPGMNVVACSFSNQINSSGQHAFGVVVAPGASGAYQVRNCRFRASLVGTVPAATGFLDASTGTTRAYSGSVSSLTADGPNVASAATVTLYGDREYRVLTGTTAITALTPTWPGHRVTFMTSSTAGFTDGGNLRLSADFTGTGNDSITLVCDGTNWYEVARSVN